MLGGDKRNLLKILEKNKDGGLSESRIKTNSSRYEDYAYGFHAILRIIRGDDKINPEDVNFDIFYEELITYIKDLPD